ncbi:MAG: hypothetical protein ACKOSS_07625 [Planctomycetia bacterium]
MRCLQVIRAVRAVLKEPAYAGLPFEVLPWEHEKSALARKSFGFGPDNHGLAVLGPAAQPLVVRPGHNYGADEIRADLDAARQRLAAR